MLVKDSYLYTLADREFYERLDRYRPNQDEFIALARRFVPKDWGTARGGLWLSCLPPDAVIPPQGWKIHLSASAVHAPLVLATACRLLVKERVAFKFAMDSAMFRLLNSKGYGRGGAGKFITIYPRDEAHCGRLLELLYHEMIGYEGPYILSDRRYRDSQVVYYRYGGLQPVRRTDVRGQRVMVMETPDGQVIDDERTPYFNLPPGVIDPFAVDAACDEQSDGEEEGTLNRGRYKIERVLSFATSGGVYEAIDRESGQRVLIKEARPQTNPSGLGTDAVGMLKKEYRILRLLEDTGVAACPLDFFRDWEHYYLVEEFLEGKILRYHIADHTLGLRVRPSAEDAREFYARYCRVYARIAEILNVIHERGIVFTDVSHYNVMVTDDGKQVHFIDFEAAYEIGIDRPTFIYTTGFAPAQMIAEGGAEPADDRYGMGGLLLAGLTPMNSLLTLNPRAHEPFMEAWQRDFGLPKEIAGCIQSLLQPDRSARIELAEVVRVLREEVQVGQPSIDTYQLDTADCQAVLERTVAYIHSTATPEREDRLFPAQPEVFDTNPLSVAFGACGVAHVLKRVTGEVRPEYLDWILRQPLAVQTYAPGLYVGLSGIAWTLLELGLGERAEDVLRMTDDHPSLCECPDLFYGAAGWGMTQLRFFLGTGDERYLTQAVRAGRHLLETREEDEGGLFWRAHDAVSCGLAHGVSGVCLFLLYLYRVMGDTAYLDTGLRGLDFVIGKARQTPDDGLTWLAREGEPTHTPYWRWGSCGVGMVLLRYQKVLDDRRYQGVLEKILVDNDRKYTVFPGRFFGLAGMSEFLLDWVRYGDRSECAMRAARKVLSGVLLFQVEREGGIAFPGESLTRISCDYASGGAGIALSLHRFLRGGEPSFMLDELLEPSALRLGTGLRIFGEGVDAERRDAAAEELVAA